MATQPARHGVLALLFVTVVINYLDRSNLSVAAASLATDLHLGPQRLGWLFSAFGITYTLCQIPGGWLADRLPARQLYATVCGLWSLATFLQGLAGTMAALFALRLLLGVFEAPAYPLCNRIVTAWFPPRERAGAIGVYTSGQFVGLAFLTPLLVLAQERWGWRAVFFGTGAVGVVWAGVWLWVGPCESRSFQSDVRARSAHGGRESGGAAASTLFDRSLVGVYLGQFAVNSTLWFFLTWFPTYLVHYRHFDFLKAGFAATLPFLAAFAGVLLSGLCSDLMVRRGVRAGIARKAPVITGLILSAAIVGANFTASHGLILFFLTLAFFGNGLASITWVFISLLAPARAVGLAGGIFNCCGNLAAIAVPAVIGVIVAHAGFAPALALMCAVALAGAASYLFLVGPIDSPTSCALSS